MLITIIAKKKEEKKEFDNELNNFHRWDWRKNWCHQLVMPWWTFGHCAILLLKDINDQSPLCFMSKF